MFRVFLPHLKCSSVLFFLNKKNTKKTLQPLPTKKHLHCNSLMLFKENENSKFQSAKILCWRFVGRMPPSIHEDKEDIFQNCLHFPINWNPLQANRFGFPKHQCTQHLPVPCHIRTLAGGIWSTCLEILITRNSTAARSLQSGAVLLQPSTTNHPPAF